MKSVVGRRVFVGSVVAGLPLVAGAGARILAQSRGGNGHQHVAAPSGDPVLDHLLREMASVHNRMQREPRGEDARAFASQLRTWAVYARAQDLDNTVSAALKEGIARQGREAILYREHDSNAARQELGRYGFQIPQRQRDAVPPADFRVRAAVLDDVLSTGATPRWVRLADMLERIAPEIDRRNGSIVRVGLMRQDAAYWAGFCAQLDKELDDVAEVVALFCGAMLWAGVFMQYQCMAAQAAYSVMLAAKIAYC